MLCKRELKDLNLHFVNSPSSEQVADIYRRLVGLTPILQEDEATLPPIFISSNTKEKPFILELIGGGE